MDMQNMKIKTLKAITKVSKDFKKNPHSFLTEGDLQCRLFFELQKLFPKEETTGDDEHKTSYVHSQIRFRHKGYFNKNSVDVVVVNPRNFDFNDYSIVYRKGYAFREPSILIELKLCKRKESINNLLKRWRLDLDKLKRLKRGRDNSVFISVLFDKFSIITNDVTRKLKSEYEGVEVMYQKSSN